MDIFKPVELFSEFITYDLLNITKDSYLASTVNFFIYDLIKIGLLLVAINYFMAFVRYYFPTEKIKNILTKRRWFGLDYFFAAALGVITPFCSCSSIPLFIGFLGAGIPLGITFAFLISSPLVNEASLYLFPAMFGMELTLVYNALGIVIAMIGGMIIQKLNLNKYVKAKFSKFKSGIKIIQNKEEKKSKKQLFLLWWKEGWEITKDLFPYVVIGVGLGAFIHGFVPENLIQGYLSSDTWWSIPVAVLLGIPFYAGSVSVIPVMEALVGKGVPIGTALAFMTSVVTISLPQILILKKVMKWELLAIFLGITITGIFIMGYVLNFIF